MQCTIVELREIKKQCDDVFHVWKKELTVQRTTLKDVAKRRNENSYTLNFDFEAPDESFFLKFIS